MNRCFLTGGTGFIGSAVTRCLARKGVELGLFVRNRIKAESLFPMGNEITLFDGDLSDHSSLAVALNEFQPDTVIHLGWAGITGGERDDLVQLKNQQATVDLVCSAVDVGVQTFVGLGSQAEYGPKMGIVNELESCEPVSLYGAAKLASQIMTMHLCRIANVRWAWLRLFSCYGPNDNPNFMLPTLIQHLLAGECPALTPGGQKWDYLYVDDAAKAIVKTAASDRGQGIFNLGSGASYPIRNIVTKIRDLVDPSLSLGFGDMPYAKNQTMHLEADTTRLRDIGWNPVTKIDQGLATTIQWHRAMRKK